MLHGALGKGFSNMKCLTIIGQYLREKEIFNSHELSPTPTKNYD